MRTLQVATWFKGIPLCLCIFVPVLRSINQMKSSPDGEGFLPIPEGVK